MPVKQVNHITSLMRVRCNGVTHLIIETELPSNPQLFESCHPVQDIKTEVDREGTRVPHGIKKWVPVLDCQNTPTLHSVAASIWSGPDCCADEASCHFWLAELGAGPPHIEWESVLHACLDDDPPAAVAVGDFTPHAFSGDGVWRKFGWLYNCCEHPLINNGIEVSLPAFGSFSAAVATAWTFPFAHSTPSVRVLTEGQVWALKDSPPFDPLLPAPNGSMVINPRTPILAAGVKVSTQGMSPTGGAFFENAAPASFLVAWWPT